MEPPVVLSSAVATGATTVPMTEMSSAEAMAPTTAKSSAATRDPSMVWK
eukprot:CAMPEP_0178642178 /NCGR_PEP_ID=MMETSP0698-20121128/17005_1 /TAXON_ID=265572 /ORGANISM="Extubocellulus spinifer, Strain CCMP396" /LENGTH=48 /DNA_ID= /DNA_START= /DNA_END= /DNA_ORIENTATION=